MIAWPVRAARQAGAGRVVVVDSAGRPLEGMLEAGVELAVQGQPDGTGGAVLAGLAHLRAEGARAAARGKQAPILVLSGDVPLVSAEWQPHLLATTVYYVKGANDPEPAPMKRAREALRALAMS